MAVSGLLRRGVCHHVIEFGRMPSLHPFIFWHLSGPLFKLSYADSGVFQGAESLAQPHRIQTGAQPTNHKNEGS